MFLKIIFPTLILFRFCTIQSNDIDVNKHCLIHNLKFSHEYLYNSKGESDIKDYSSNIITRPLNKVDDFIKLTWIFIPVKVNQVQIIHMNKSLYLIRSGQNANEYLCSTNEFEKISPIRRLIKLFKINENDKFEYYNCFWNYEKVYLNKTFLGFKEFETVFVLRNMLMNEPMYAASFFFNNGWDKRSVFTWVPKKGSDSNKFKWIIDCSKGELIYSK
jgi:hypothetical protein